MLAGHCGKIRGEARWREGWLNGGQFNRPGASASSDGAAGAAGFTRSHKSRRLAFNMTRVFAQKTRCPLKAGRELVMTIETFERVASHRRCSRNAWGEEKLGLGR